LFLNITGASAAAPGSGTVITSGTGSIDFGAFPGKSDATLVITGQSGILAGSIVKAWLYPATTADHSVDEHTVETIQVSAGTIVAGTGFTIYARNTGVINEKPLGWEASGYKAGNAGQGTRLYGLWSVAWMWF